MTLTGPLRSCCRDLEANRPFARSPGDLDGAAWLRYPWGVRLEEADALVGQLDRVTNDDAGPLPFPGLRDGIVTRQGRNRAAGSESRRRRRVEPGPEGTRLTLIVLAGPAL
jgi:hypothetical protein